MKYFLLQFFVMTLSLPCLATFSVIHSESVGKLKIDVEEIVSNLNIPWGFEFLDDDQIIITEKNGVISVFNLKTQKKVILQNAPNVFDSGQGGLLDIKKHPQYPQEPWLYVTFSEKVNGKGTTTLGRFQIKNNKILKFEKLLLGKARTNTGRHFGSRIAFDDKGLVYFGIGDRGHRPNGQDLNTHAGSIIRLHADGSIPKDNPFVGQKGKQAAIWSYGHRNPQGLVFDKKRKILWEQEHGPRGGDEINQIKKAGNFGWAEVSYGKEYSNPKAVGVKQKKGTIQPFHYWDPSIAPCGLEVYYGQVFPQWQGSLFSGALKLTHLNRLDIANGKVVKEERMLKKLGMRIRQVKEGPDGLIYFSVDRGKILRIKPRTPE